MSIFDRTFLRSASGTRFTHKIARAVVGGLLALGAASALQAATLSTLTAGPPNDGVLQNFSGIDWNANGGSWIQGFGLSGANVAGDTSDFTFTYQAFAGSIGTTSPTTNLYVSSPGPASGSYELTTYATLFETATCLNNGCSTISIALTAGLTSTWAVYFDITPDANQGAGSGFLDGVQILGGNFLSGLTTFLATGPIGPGSIGTGGGFLSGEVTYTNAAYVAPDLLGTTLQASLQFPGQSSPTYSRPSAFNGVATGADTGTNFVLQTDTSQNFVAAAVPEPGSVMLLAIGLLGMVAFVRRNAQRPAQSDAATAAGGGAVPA